MNSGEWLQISTHQLKKAGISTARLDCLVLLEDATGRDRAWLLAHPEENLKGPSFQVLDEWIERRSRHEPLAYIRGKSEFYAREFRVSKDTLEPRPETETMIELLKQLATKDSAAIIDAGTGSGCLAITARLEFPDTKVWATDISPACIKIAQRNAKDLGVDVKFYLGNLLHPLPSTVYLLPSTIILANLPYVPESHTINQAAMHEPKVAIFGGEDGLDLYRQLFAQIQKLQHKPQYVLTESLPPQHSELIKIAEKANYYDVSSKDFIQCFKMP